MTRKAWRSGLLATLAIAGFAAVAASPAEAQYYHRNRGWSPGAAAAVGAVGGLALGAALAAPRPAYGYYAPAPAYGYYAPRPVYVAPPRPVYVEPAPECFVRRERVWVPGWGWRVQRVRVCDEY